MHTSSEVTTVLFVNPMWDAPLVMPEAVPADFRLSSDRALLPTADVLVFHLPSLPPQLFGPGGLRKRPGQIWVAWFLECEVHYPHLADPAFMAAFELSMSHRADADVITPYGDPALLRTPLPEPCPKDSQHLVAAFLSSRFDRSGRCDYLRGLAEAMEVHSYGSFLNNRPRLGDDGAGFKQRTIARYRFTVAFENAIAPGYVTEKFYQPLLAGSVPLVLGAPDIASLAPSSDCYIDVADWPDPRQLARHLQELSADEAAYARFHRWRTQPLPQALRQRLELLEQNPFLRLCERLRQLRRG